MAIRVVFVEKRKDVVKALQILLKNRGIELIPFATPAEANTHNANADALVVAAADPSCENTLHLVSKYIDRSKPTIAITSFAMAHNIEELYKSGFDEVIPEPLNVERLIGTIQKFDNVN
jgi:DNA-binding NtrC family response regulator